MTLRNPTWLALATSLLMMMAVPVSAESPDAASGGARLDLSPSDHLVEVRWDAIADAVEYHVHRDGTRIASVDAGQTSYVDGVVANGQRASYHVTATLADGLEAASELLSGTPVDIVAPAPLKVANLVRLSRGVYVLYERASSHVGQLLMRAYVDGELVGHHLSTATSGGFAIAGIVDLTMDRVELVVEDLAGNISGFAPKVLSGGYGADSKPPIPLDLRVTSCFNGRAGLRWTAVDAGDTGDGAVGFHVYRDGELEAVVTETSYVATELPFEQETTFTVRAVNADSVLSPESQSARITPQDLGKVARLVEDVSGRQDVLPECRAQVDPCAPTAPLPPKLEKVDGDTMGSSSHWTGTLVRMERVGAAYRLYVDGVLTRVGSDPATLGTAVPLSGVPVDGSRLITVESIDLCGRVSASASLRLDLFKHLEPIGFDLSWVPTVTELLDGSLQLVWDALENAGSYKVWVDGKLQQTVEAPSAVIPPADGPAVRTIRIQAEPLVGVASTPQSTPLFVRTA